MLAIVTPEASWKGEADTDPQGGANARPVLSEWPIDVCSYARGTSAVEAWRDPE